LLSEFVVLLVLVLGVAIFIFIFIFILYFMCTLLYSFNNNNCDTHGVATT